MHEGIEYPCKTCKKNFTSKAGLSIHIQSVHEGLKLHFCKKCGKKFSNGGGLFYHIKKVHEGISFEYPCIICKKVFASKVRLNTHVQSIHEGVNFLCDMCNFEATRKDHLKTHKKNKHKDQYLFDTIKGMTSDQVNISKLGF